MAGENDNTRNLDPEYNEPNYLHNFDDASHDVIAQFDIDNEQLEFQRDRITINEFTPLDDKELDAMYSNPQEVVEPDQPVEIAEPDPPVEIAEPDQPIEFAEPVVLFLKKKFGDTIQEVELEPSSSEAVPVPKHLSFKLPRGWQLEVGLSSAEEQANNIISSGNESKTTWSKAITFQLPSSIHQDLEKMDTELLVLSSKYLPLAQRLEGWKIRQVTKSGKKRADKTFCHQGSGKSYRSFLELESFIVFAGSKEHLSLKRKQPEEPPQSEQFQVQPPQPLLREIRENINESTGHDQRKKGTGKGYLKVNRNFPSIETSGTASSSDTEDDS